MRVVAGALRGRRIQAPPGLATRPTADRVREAVFSIVGGVEGRDVLDLFAGSGALGIEALSRGARFATFVDRSPRVAACVRANLASLGLTDRSRVLARDWRAGIAAERGAGGRFGLCLIDPPYTLTAGIAQALGPALAPVLADGATVVIEHASALHLGPIRGLEIATRIDRTYGDSAITVLRLRHER